MKRLIVFIEHNFYIMLFVVLQVFCAVLIFRLNPYQQASFTHSFTKITAKTNAFSSNIRDFVGLKEQNIMLQQQIAQNLYASPKNQLYYLQDTFVIRDTFSRPLYTIVPAGVVANTAYKANNTFIINKGLDHGIEKNMGVLSSTGVAGIVLESNAKYSTVMSLLNTNMKLIPSINGEEYYTDIVWDNVRPNDMRINGINKLEKIKEGDVVNTGSSSSLFPKGIPIGTIYEMKSLANKQYFVTRIKTATNFRNLEYVYVLINNEKKYLEPLLSDD